MPEKTPDLHEDLELISLFQKSGDLHYLGVLYKKYMHLVYGVCLKYYKDRELSQDAVMQIFEQLVVKLADQHVENFKSWLYVLSKNHCLMHLRSSRYKMEQQAKNIDDVPVESELLLHHSNEEILEENLQSLEHCIEQLQNEQKQCIELFYIQNKSYKEIENITKHESKKVKSYIQNGKRNLKICMENNK